MLNEYAKLQKEFKKLIDDNIDYAGVSDWLIDNELSETVDSAKEILLDRAQNIEFVDDITEVVKLLDTFENAGLYSPDNDNDIINFSYWDGAEKLTESELKEYISELKDIIKNGY